VSTTITQCAGDADYADARALFAEYGAALRGHIECLDGFAAEVAGLPGAYAPPAGRLLLARAAGVPAGCVALRPLAGDAAELKRLYVRPAHRGTGLGRRLVEHLLGEARGAGYRQIYLDTHPSFTAAIALYHALGFRLVGPYSARPTPGALYYELTIA
jgi:ribosomal protein S18 acetylase RimI-like enzyme